jgi:hypothetical protein
MLQYIVYEVHTSIPEKPAVSVFFPEEGGSRFL